MKTTIVTLALAALPLAAQTPNTAFQYVFTNSGDGATKVIKFEGLSKTVTGHPLTATEERHTLQVLADGTRIESTTTNKFYRDAEGRTRIEREDGTVLIEDPTNGSTVEIHGNQTTSRGISVAKMTNGIALDALSRAKIEAEVKALETPVTRSYSSIKSNSTTGAFVSKTDAEAIAKAQAGSKENLGFQSLNGVQAEGTRITTTIPQGQIGNDRPIQIVSETWSSPEIQTLVKSSTKDPRFGETTYEMKNIVQGVPDPALFKTNTQK